MDIQWAKDTRPKPNGSYALVNGRKFKTVYDNKVQRFRANRIIRDLVDAARDGAKLDLNEITVRAARGLYSKDEMHELYRLMGYSVCGFSEVFETDDVRSSSWR